MDGRTESSQQDSHYSDGGKEKTGEVQDCQLSGAGHTESGKRQEFVKAKCINETAVEEVVLGGSDMEDDEVVLKVLHLKRKTVAVRGKERDSKQDKRKNNNETERCRNCFQHGGRRCC